LKHETLSTASEIVAWAHKMSVLTYSIDIGCLDRIAGGCRVKEIAVKTCAIRLDECAFAALWLGGMLGVGGCCCSVGQLQGLCEVRQTGHAGEPGGVFRHGLFVGGSKQGLQLGSLRIQNEYPQAASKCRCGPLVARIPRKSDGLASRRPRHTVLTGSSARKASKLWSMRTALP
jgi:hypothetical protein